MWFLRIKIKESSHTFDEVLMLVRFAALKEREFNFLSDVLDAVTVFGSLRAADVFPVVAEREATTGNTSAVRRLRLRILRSLFVPQIGKP